MDQDKKTNYSGIWRSKLGWSITLVVFMTIMIVQSSFSFVTLKMFEEDRKSDMREFARSSVISVLDLGRQPPLTAKAAETILTRTRITGITLYTQDARHIESYGQLAVISPQAGESAEEAYLAPDRQTYEMLFYPHEIGVPNIMAVRVDSSALLADLKEFIVLRVLIALLLSIFVTHVLMLALGNWLVTPLLVLKHKLLSAAKDPENPVLEGAIQVKAKSEVKAVLDSADNLILQNAKNIRQLRETAQSQIHKLAYYDPLTELPNRTYFVEQLQKRSASDANKHFAVIAVDLDHFRDINDTVGHHVGDLILRSVAKRLLASIPSDAVLARSGEDEFAIMLPYDDAADPAVGDMAEAIAKAIRGKPFNALDEEFQIRSSIGIAHFPDDSDDPDQVLKCADIALNRAKEEGRDAMRVYSRAFDDIVQQRFTMLKDLRKAMDNKELQLHYQPQFSLETGAFVGAEALLRWWKKGPEGVGGQYVSPAEFVPVAEQSGLIVPIGKWVMKEACRQCVEWRMAGHEAVRVAVNVSAVQFQQDDLPQMVADILKDTGLPADRLELEVTESVFMDDIDHMIQILRDLNDLGVELAIDDFGTGYSSLSYLRRFPIDRLKIDRSFIVDASDSEDGSSIARTIIALGKSLNLETIAEGVETIEQQEFLIKEGCELVQGFRYAKPMPSEQVMEFMKNYTGDITTFDD